MTTTQFLWERKAFPAGLGTGVSLHSHTAHSHEPLVGVRSFTGNFRLLPALLHWTGRHHRKATGEEFDLRRTFWTPPLEPHAAWHVEARQIEWLGLTPLVSLSDHDNIEAGLSLAGPVSVEWTVPFASTFFHIGVHNLPRASARDVMAALAAYTARPRMASLGALLEWLDSRPEVLLVFNHPLWDEAGIGAHLHRVAVSKFLTVYRPFVHALELNGLRPWKENADVMDLGGEFGMPLVSGGDRHGAEPAANLNLTRANTFAEFVAEIREDALSHVLFLPRYRRSMNLRWLEVAEDVVRYYPAMEPDRRHWTGRFFCEAAGGVVRSLAALWKGSTPRGFSSGFWVLGATRRIRSAFPA